MAKTYTPGQIVTLLDGYKDYGPLEVLAAPLTLDEHRKYSEVIPDPDKACWLATGLGGLKHLGSVRALCEGSIGFWDDCFCSYDIRTADEPDLSEYSTDVLLAEVRRRMEENQK